MGFVDAGKLPQHMCCGGGTGRRGWRAVAIGGAVAGGQGFGHLSRGVAGSAFGWPTCPGFGLEERPELDEEQRVRTALVGWAILFPLHRNGRHCFSEGGQWRHKAKAPS